MIFNTQAGPLARGGQARAGKAPPSPSLHTSENQTVQKQTPSLSVVSVHRQMYCIVFALALPGSRGPATFLKRSRLRQQGRTSAIELKTPASRTRHRHERNKHEEAVIVVAPALSTMPH